LGIASESLSKIVKNMSGNAKVEAVFVTNIGGKEVDWDMVFQFNLDNEDSFYLKVKGRKAELINGTTSNPNIIIVGDNSAIVKICHGKGDFTHAISREEIKVTKGKIIEVIRLTRAITLVLKTK
jgi:putative sterol carrier protein